MENIRYPWIILELIKGLEKNEKEKENHLKVFSWIATRSIILKDQDKVNYSLFDCDEYCLPYLWPNSGIIEKQIRVPEHASTIFSSSSTRL